MLRFHISPDYHTFLTNGQTRRGVNALEDLGASCRRSTSLRYEKIGTQERAVVTGEMNRLSAYSLIKTPPVANASGVPVAMPRWPRRTTGRASMPNMSASSAGTTTVAMEARLFSVLKTGRVVAELSAHRGVGSSAHRGQALSALVRRGDVAPVGRVERPGSPHSGCGTRVRAGGRSAPHG